MMTRNAQRIVLSITVCLTMAASTAAFSGHDNEDTRAEKARRPAVVLRVDQNVGMAPMRVTLTADLIGGADDYQAFYCPAIEWDWGDGTESDASFDCQPYQPHVSKIVRHFSVAHVFEEGEYHVTFRLKRDERELASTDAKLLVG
jgi:hypothetical protein